MNAEGKANVAVRGLRAACAPLAGESAGPGRFFVRPADLRPADAKVSRGLAKALKTSSGPLQPVIARAVGIQVPCRRSLTPACLRGRLLPS